MSMNLETEETVGILKALVGKKCQFIGLLPQGQVEAYVLEVNSTWVKLSRDPTGRLGVGWWRHQMAISIGTLPDND